MKANKQPREALHWNIICRHLPHNKPFTTCEVGYSMAPHLRVGGTTGYVYTGNALNWALKQALPGLRKLGRAVWVYEPVNNARA